MLLSIVTICKNNMEGLYATLNSISQQTFQNWECIVVLGESTDQSLAVAQLFGNDSRFTLVEQTGTGIYAAMNLGLFRSKGNFVNFMNSGDIFSDEGVLKNCVSKLSEMHKVGLVFGGYSFFRKDKSICIYRKSDQRISARKLAFTRRACHQSMFFDTELAKSLGGYSLEYCFASDYDLALKMASATSAHRLNIDVSRIQRNGLSETNIEKVVIERFNIRQKLLAGTFNCFFNYIWTLLLIAKISLFPNRD